MPESQPTSHDAELILKLYDLRREPVMREARAFVAQFAPKSLDDMLKIANAFGTREQAFLRQVVGYWEMAASLVNRSAPSVGSASGTFLPLTLRFIKTLPLSPYFSKTCTDSSLSL